MRTRKFSELTKDWSPERRERVAKRVRETLDAMHLEELRKARAMTQTKLAETLGVAQSEISKIEHRTDLYIISARSRNTSRPLVESWKFEQYSQRPRSKSRSSSICQRPCSYHRFGFEYSSDDMWVANS